MSSLALTVVDIIKLTGIIPAILAGFATLLSAIMTMYLNKNSSKSKEIYKKEVEEIASAARASAAEARSRAMQALAEKIPAGATKEEIESFLTSHVSIGGNLVITQNASENRDIIEGLVTNYHQQALSQARVQFWFSVAAATVGFIYILYSSISINVDNLITTMKILPGVVIDAIAVLFFRQAEQTRQRATELYDRLRTDRQSLRAESVMESIEDINIKSAVKAQVALHLVGLSPKEIDLQTFVTRNRP